MHTHKDKDPLRLPIIHIVLSSLRVKELVLVVFLGLVPVMFLVLGLRWVLRLFVGLEPLLQGLAFQMGLSTRVLSSLLL